MQCERTFTGEHMYNPRRWSTHGDGRGPYTTFYQCVCGAKATDEKAVLLALQETADEQKRQKDEARRLTGSKRMKDLGEAPLPGFEAYL